VALYLINRFALRPLFSEHTEFFQAYVNDLLLAAFWIPPALWAARRLGVRGHDGPPTFGEIAITLLVWSVLFEIVAPRLDFSRSSVGVGDPRDVLCYVAGAAAAAWCGTAAAGTRRGRLEGGSIEFKAQRN
jgi:hypothetical protein